MGHRNTSREKARRRHRHHRAVMVALGHRLVTMRLMGPHPIPILRRSGGVDWNEWVYPDPGERIRRAADELERAIRRVAP